MKIQNDVDTAVSFEINNLLYMTESLNQWLSKAITHPENNDEVKYYYNKQQRELFMVDKADGVLINADSLEIPCLSLKERIAIQMDFIHRIENFGLFDRVVSEINKQDKNSSFILDNLLLSDKKLNLLIDYWAEFKVEQLNYVINDFEDEHDINLKAANIR
ncbi:MAG: hypothetical protein AAGC65_02050 [Mucilaginibacter sp.]|uniref:hypothetical protein n=1 Tax=Mucilaginibacter sp. TaxID=1882438 RepID=UPI0031A8CFD1